MKAKPAILLQRFGEANYISPMEEHAWRRLSGETEFICLVSEAALWRMGYDILLRKTCQQKHYEKPPLTSSAATLGAALSSWGKQALSRRAAERGAGPGATGHAASGADAQRAGRGAPLAVVLQGRETKKG